MTPNLTNIPYSREFVPSNIPDAVYSTGWHILFTRCEQISQRYGSNNEHALARLSFRITRGTDSAGTHIRDFTCEINQPHGESYTFDRGPLVLMLPAELQGRVNYEQFRTCAEGYYRTAMRNGLGLGFGQEGMLMGNNTVTELGYAIVEATGPNTNSAW